MQPVLPEIFLLTAACLILVVDLFLTDRTRLLTYGLSLATLIGAVALNVISGLEPTTARDWAGLHDGDCGCANRDAWLV